jgi:hypothetical protein
MLLKEIIRMEHCCRNERKEVKSMTLTNSNILRDAPAPTVTPMFHAELRVFILLRRLEACESWQRGYFRCYICCPYLSDD